MAADTRQWNSGSEANPSFDLPEPHSPMNPQQPIADEEDDDEQSFTPQSPALPSSPFTPYVPPTPPAGWHAFRSVEKGGGGNCGFCSISAGLGISQQEVRNGIDQIENAIAKHDFAYRLASAKNDFEYGQYYGTAASFDALKAEIKRAGVHELDIHSIRLMELAHNVVIIAVAAMNLDARTYTFNYGCFGAVEDPLRVILLNGGRGHYTALEHAQTGSNGFATGGGPDWPADVQQLVYDCYRESSKPIPGVVDAKIAAVRACWVRNNVCKEDRTRSRGCFGKHKPVIMGVYEFFFRTGWGVPLPFSEEFEWI